MKNIIFDFGGVLLEWSSDYFYLPYFNNDQEAMEKFYEETQIKVLNRDIDKGVPFDVVLKDLAIKFPHHKDPILLWKKAWHKMIGNEIQGSIDILYTLHSNGYKLYGLTNWSGETFPYVYYKYEFFHLFEDIIVSGREKTIKPEADIYHICLTRNNLKGNDSVFIDDNLDNVIAAQNLGMKGVHFLNPQQLQNSLVSLGINL